MVAIQQRRYYGQPVALGPERGIHLGVDVIVQSALTTGHFSWPPPADRIFGEGEMMRGRLAGYMQPFRLCRVNGLEGSRGRHMLHMEMRSHSFGPLDLAQQPDVALHDPRLRLYGHSAQPEPEGQPAMVHAASAGHPGVFRVL